MTTYAQFYQDLEKHDWHYEKSDDHSYWRRGNEEWKAIREKCRQDAVCDQLYKAFVAHVFEGAEKPTMEFLQTLLLESQVKQAA